VNIEIVIIVLKEDQIKSIVKYNVKEMKLNINKERKKRN
jgi:hypothetical protein